MALFQSSVQKEAIRKLDSNKLAQAYQTFKQQFNDPVFQENVRAAKEEQYQEGFLNDLFVKVLGYTLHPQPAFDLITEQKNLKNAQKADGAILRDGQPIAVIELKSMRTIDLQTIEIQAFAYKNNQPTARYVITSNFQKLRFYMDNAVDFEEFDLFALSETDFGLLYLCLHKAQLFADAPAKLKTASLQKEEQITHQLYNDYSKFKDELYINLKQWNRSYDVLTLFKKSQKLLDRFLFFCFAEDKGLLPANTLSAILKQWETLRSLDEAKPLYDIFKKYFRYLNSGHQSEHLNIFGYNGGLFAPDPLLDALTISDGLLYTNIPTLSKYNFDSEVDTNILGHIFEHSLNELDEKTAQAVGQTADKSKTKRKKDGIFYTPRYITQYIVEQTMGALCKQKQVELAIDRLDWWEDCPSAIAIMRLHQYRGWLLQLTVLDPACGSGAFLNQAFVFLRAEHRNIDAMLATLTGKTVENTDWATHILDHNLFGVDINEESVEIAKLSLWLRTAKIGRKLNDLSANIQVGNSLISDPEVAGALAFDWQKGFPQVFEKGGFDVVIGNPPYVVYLKSIFGEKVLNYVNQNYDYSEYNPNTYALFTELALNLLKPLGFLGFIIPNSWMHNKYFSKMRNGVYSKFIQEIAYLKNTAFQEVVETLLLILQNKDTISDSIKLTSDVVKNTYEVQKFHYESYKNGYNPFVQNQNSLMDNLDKQTTLKQFAMVYRGLETTNNDKWLAYTRIDENYKPILLGKDVNRYFTEYSGSYVKFIKEAIKSNANEVFYAKNKILMRRTGSTIIADVDFKKTFALKNLYLIIPKIEPNIYSILAQLNSKLLNYYHKCKTSAENKAFAQFSGEYIEQFPCIINDTIDFKQLIEQMLSLNAQLREAQTDFLNLLTDSFPSLKVNKAVESWHESDFAALKKNMEKQKGVSIDDLNEVKKWRKQFDLEKKAYSDLQQQIATTDKAIDAAVYALYELTPEEIQIIENQ